MSENKAEKLFNSITNIKEEHIEFANGAKAVPKAKKKVTVLIKYIGLAACLGLAIFAGARPMTKKPQVDPELPMLTITENDVGMGFEGYMAHDISELVSGNPWDEAAKISTLPVYENMIKYDIIQNASGHDLEKMREYLMELVDKLGLDKDTLIFKDNAPLQNQIDATMGDLEDLGLLPIPNGYFDPTELTATDGNIEVTVDAHMDVDIFFKNGMALPSEYNFTNHAPFSDVTEVAEYLKEIYVLGKFKDIIGIENPQINITGGDYDIYERQGYHISFFEKSKNITESIENYNLSGVSFYCDDKGNLWIIRINNNACTKKVGDYPIISTDEAKVLLLEGKYATSVVQWDMPGQEYIAKVELIYRASRRDEFFIPYYRFYIELPEASPGVKDEFGLKTYGAYYVPAVEGRYIENMPVYDGHFN